MALGTEPAGQHRRILWLATIFAAIGLYLLGRTAYWQLLPHPELINLGPSGIDRTNVIPAARGDILDANGQYLAASSVEYKIGVSPRLLSKKEKLKYTPLLAQILNRPEAEITALLNEKGESVLLAEHQSVWVAEQIEAIPSSAFILEMSLRRVYPDDTLAASVLGFIDYQGHAQYGLEQYYDTELKGQDGEWRGIGDSWGEQIMMNLGGYRPARDGDDLVLTLDRNIQRMAEQVLLDGIRKNKATSGNIIVLDPKTGAILAMANYPTYNPAKYGEFEPEQIPTPTPGPSPTPDPALAGVAAPAQTVTPDPSLFFVRFVNSGVSAIYEPGSVFKPLTLAAALEARVIRPDDTYDDRGEIIVGGQRIQNSDRQAHGKTTMTQLLAYSRNVGAAHVATLLGPTRFYEIIRRFGFSEHTGVDLAIEATGVMRVPGNPYWHMSDLGTNSFGQGISVTPLQMVAAYGALANDGLLMRPYIVREIRQGDTVQARQPFAVRRVVSQETAQQITKLMADAVEMAMYEKAGIAGYRLAGKSGTSGIPDKNGYAGKDVIASFAGYGPLPNPRFVVLVKYDKPKEGYWGGDVAAPEWRTMVQFLLDYYGIPPAR